MRETELGWAILSAHWGHGYATEAALAARDWIERDRIISLIHPANVRSQRVAEKLGARIEQRVDDAERGRQTSGSIPDELPAARGQARRRRHVVARRADVHAAPRVARRGRDQDRAAGRRPCARVGPTVHRRRGRDVPRRKRGQALARARSLDAGRNRRVARARRARRRVRPEPPARRGRAARFRRGDAARATAGARPLLDRRVRIDRPAARPARVRPVAAGGERDHERHRRRWNAAGARRRVAHRSLDRPLGGVRDRQRAHARRRRDDRGVAVRDRALAAVVADRRVPRHRRRAADARGARSRRSRPTRCSRRATAS